MKSSKKDSNEAKKFLDRAEKKAFKNPITCVFVNKCIFEGFLCKKLAYKTEKERFLTNKIKKSEKNFKKFSNSSCTIYKSVL